MKFPLKLETGSVTSRRMAGISLIECMVYIGLFFVIVCAGYTAMYQATDNAKNLRRNSDDIAAALSVGERWRQDIREAAGQIRVEGSETNQSVRIPQKQGVIIYEFAEGRLRRQARFDAPWMVLLSRVEASVMAADPGQRVMAWRWELTLKGSSHKVRKKPMFSFAAVPATKETP